MAYRAGSSILSSVLSIEDIKDIDRKKKEGVSAQTLADEYGVHKNTIYNVIDRLKYMKAKNPDNEAYKNE